MLTLSEVCESDCVGICFDSVFGLRVIRFVIKK